jgi:hyaluronoglucosaminidase
MAADAPTLLLRLLLTATCCCAVGTTTYCTAGAGDEPATTHQAPGKNDKGWPPAMALAPPSPPSRAPPFDVVWNMATAPCQGCVNSSDHVKPWTLGVTANANGSFDGSAVVCLYHFGLPPRLSCSNKTAWPTPPEDIAITQNGGVPQSKVFNMSAHLVQLRRDVARYIPDPNFAGYAVIDKEDWEPLFCSNWVSGGSRYYNIFSESLVAAEHPHWNSSQVRAEATRQWDAAARAFYLRSLEEARRLRPRALWGYFGQPVAPPGPLAAHAHQVSVRVANQRLRWLWSAVDLLVPSIYVHQRPEQQRPHSEYTANLTAQTAATINASLNIAHAAAVGRVHRVRGPF